MTASVLMTRTMKLRLLRLGIDSHSKPTWHVRSEDGEIDILIRANDRGTAIERVRLQYPNVIFTR